MRCCASQSQHVRLSLDMYQAARYDDDDHDHDDSQLRKHDAAESDVIRAFEDAFARED